MIVLKALTLHLEEKVDMQMMTIIGIPIHHRHHHRRHIKEKHQRKDHIVGILIEDVILRALLHQDLRPIVRDLIPPSPLVGYAENLDHHPQNFQKQIEIEELYLFNN